MAIYRLSASPVYKTRAKSATFALSLNKTGNQVDQFSGGSSSLCATHCNHQIIITTIMKYCNNNSSALLALCLVGAVCTLAGAAVLSPTMSSPADPSEPAPLVRVRRGHLTEEAERLLKQAGQVDVNNVGQLVDLVERNKADECLARVICELSNNPRSHGDQGAKFAQSLLKFRQSKHPKVKQFVDAMGNGAKSKNPDQCRAYYPRCSHSTAEVVSVGNKLLHRA